MKKIFLVWATGLISLGAMSTASALTPRWEAECIPTWNAPGNTWANIKTSGSVLVIAANIGYIGVDLLCSFEGNCRGFSMGSAPVRSDSASLITDTDGKVIGFKFMDFAFSCQ